MSEIRPMSMADSRWPSDFAIRPLTRWPNVRLQPRRPMIPPAAVGCKPKLAGPSNAAPARTERARGERRARQLEAARPGHDARRPHKLGVRHRCGVSHRRGVPRRRPCLAAGTRRRHCHAPSRTSAGAPEMPGWPRIAPARCTKTYARIPMRPTSNTKLKESELSLPG